MHNAANLGSTENKNIFSWWTTTKNKRPIHSHPHASIIARNPQKQKYTKVHELYMYINFQLPEYKYAPSEEKERTLTTVGCQCHVEHESASSLSLTPGLSSWTSINLSFTTLFPIAKVLLPNPLQIKILPVTSPAATILWVGWNAMTVIFFVWCSVIFVTAACSDPGSGTFHTWSLHLFWMPKNFPEGLTVKTSGFFVCRRKRQT